MIQTLLSTTPLAYISVGMGILTAIVLFRFFFDDLPNFFDCLRLAIQPDLISIFTGEWTESHRAAVKLTFWILPSIMSGYAAYADFPKWWPGIFH